jgi:hypothetical protein
MAISIFLIFDRTVFKDKNRNVIHMYTADRQIVKVKKNIKGKYRAMKLICYRVIHESEIV